MHHVTDAEMTTYQITGQPLKDSSWAFYESDSSKSYLNGYVQINQSNTGEPGRDVGCNVAGIGTTAIIPGPTAGYKLFVVLPLIAACFPGIILPD